MAAKNRHDVSSPARLFLNEDLCEAETAAGKILCVVVTNQSNAFLADFREIDFPSHLGDFIRINAGPLRLLLRLLLTRPRRLIAG